MCNQEYQGDHRLAMAEAFVQMADQIDDIDPYRYGEALWTKLLAVDEDPEESKKTANEMILMLEKVDEPYKCASWARNPKAHSDSAKNLMSLAYEKLGWQATKEGVRTKGSEEEASAKFKEAIKYYTKYQSLARAVGNSYHVQDAATKIARTKQMDPLEKNVVKQKISLLRAEYERDPSEGNCTNLIFALRLEGRAIELERFAAKHLNKNKRLLGPTHPTTLEQECGIKGMAVRKLTLVGDDDDTDYRFVRYEGDECVLAPMKSAHDFPGGNDYEEGKEFSIDIADMPEKIRLGPGTPVVCVGLKSTVQLNGMLGDARKYNKETKRYQVRFEDPSVTPRTASVKLSNLQIVLELPPKE